MVSNSPAPPSPALHVAEGILRPPVGFADPSRWAIGCATRLFTQGGAERPRRAAALARTLEPGVRAVLMGGQCHECRAATVDSALVERATASAPVGDVAVMALERHDIFVTREPGVMLALYTADCVPLVASDDDAGVAGVAHAGWRGTLANAALALVQAMSNLGARPERLHVWIAPAIERDSYEVSPEIIGQWHTAYPDFAGEVCTGRMLDLPETNRRQLLAAGVDPGRIAMSPGHCTLRHPETFFSYRRDQACGAHQITGIARRCR